MTEADILQSILTAGGGVGTGGGIVYLIAKSMLERAMRKFDDLSEEVKQLREKEVADLKKRVDAMQENCKKDQSLERMNNIIGWMKKIDMKIDAIVADTATMKADTAALTSDMLGKSVWIGNLNQVVSDHVKDHKIHKGG